MNLKDKVAIVTGSGRGIGRAVAIELAGAGAAVVCCSRTISEVEETAGMIRGAGGRSLAIALDVADKEQVRQLVDRTEREFSRIDVLFNNAARLPVISGLWEVDADAWWDEITVNLRGPMLLSRAVLPGMMKRNEGVIINMSGGQNIPGRTSYCCSKAALMKMTELLARELDSVKSNVITFGMSPGLVKTRRTLVEAESAQGRHWNPKTREMFEENQDRPPTDCARAVVKLLGGLSKEMNGKSFVAGEVLGLK